MTVPETPVEVTSRRGANTVTSTGNQRRMPVPYDVVAVCPGFVVDGRHLESVLLTVVTVSLDGHEVDATEVTGGSLFHLDDSQFRLVSPPRGSW